MISFPDNLPALKIGRQHVTGYDTAWISEALRRAAIDAGREDFPFIDDIHAGIRHYLQNRCPLSTLPLEDLFDRIRGMLERIGCPAMAFTLRPCAPPVTLSLATVAREAGNGYELLFFHQLHQDLQEFERCGVQTLRIRDLRTSALILRGRKNFTASCRRLEADITAHLHHFQTTTARQLLFEDEK